MKQLKKPKPKRRKLARKNKFWQKLKGTYKEENKYDFDHNALAKDVERLIAAIQQELIWDDTDIKTWDAIQENIIDWSGQINKKYLRKSKKTLRRK